MTRLLFLAMICGLAAAATSAQDQTTSAAGPATRNIVLGAGAWNGYSLVGFNPYGNKQSFYAQPLSTRPTAMLNVHARGSEERKGAEEVSQLIRFDLANLPKDAVIKQAWLVLPIVANAKTGEKSPNVLTISQIQQPWTNQVDWKTYDGEHPWQTEGAQGDKDRRKAAELQIPDQKYNYKTPFEARVDLTDLVKSWASGTAPNNGMKFDLSGGYIDYIPDHFRLEIVIEDH